MQAHPDWSRTSTSTGYIVVYCPDHPAAWSTGYLYAHRVVMEGVIGRYLSRKEIVHHKDGNRKNNNPSNLQVLSGHSEHRKVHGITYVKCAQCGATIKRKRCRVAGARPGYKNNFCDMKCAGLFKSGKAMNALGPITALIPNW